MKSLERKFNNIAEKNPNLSSYICFTKAIKGQEFSKQTIHRWFQKLVDKEDYDNRDKTAILEQLENLANHH
jgi:predicted RNA-binding protein YlxR (DUF448 family)